CCSAQNEQGCEYKLRCFAGPCKRNSSGQYPARKGNQQSEDHVRYDEVQSVGASDPRFTKEVEPKKHKHMSPMRVQRVGPTNVLMQLRKPCLYKRLERREDPSQQIVILLKE